MLYISGISISLFISALLINKKQKSRADILLMVWMMAMAIHLFIYYINFSSTPYQIPHLLGLEIPYPLMHGPLLYLYVASITNQLPKHNWIHILHFVPVSIGYLYLISFFSSPASQKIAFYQNGYKDYEGFMQFGLLLIFLSGLVYLVWSIILLIRHKKNIQHEFSDLESVNLNWLQFLILGFAIIWSIVIFINKDEYIFTGVTVFVILTGYLGVQQRTIFDNRDLSVKPSVESRDYTVDGKKKYENSGLSEQLADKIHERLLHLFEKEYYYKRNKFSIQELASELDIHPNYLSQIINEKEGKSFYDFVNAFRLEAFKEMVENQEHKQLTLLALAYECGFNSKSSFNRYFKKQTGQTPSEFVKSLKNQS